MTSKDPFFYTLGFTSVELIPPPNVCCGIHNRKKIDDPLLNLIYRFLYVIAFLLSIFLGTESIHLTDFDPPQYLLLKTSGHNLLLEAVERSRIKTAKFKTKNLQS